MKTMNIYIIGDLHGDKNPIRNFYNIHIKGTPRELIEFLSHSHDVEHQVKMFAIVDDWTGELANYEPEEVDAMFYFLEGLEPWEEAEFDLTFNLFWESANRSWW